MNSTQHILNLSPQELEAWFERTGQPTYRASQVLRWIYQQRATEFSRMTNLSKQLREKLENQFHLLDGKVEICRESIDGTKKLLICFRDNKKVETVLIPAKDRLTVCLSTQAGCPVGCAFCATGQGEFQGHLSAGQIVEQLLHLQLIADEQEKRITNVVFMGMGEPLLNYDNTINALRTINAKWGFNIGARKITISTIGVPEKIRKLASENLQITLALSLHHVEQAKREKLIPLAKKYPLPKIIQAAKYYFEKTGREVTLEYLLLSDINSSEKEAEKLADIAHTLRANVNLIAYNPTAQSEFTAPHQLPIRRFMNTLKERGINVHLRASKGKEIDAACGQLRNSPGP